MKRLTMFMAMMLVLATGACKQRLDSASLKDDVFAEADTEAHLYWLVGQGDEQHVCRAKCDRQKMVVKGDLDETRSSCDKGTAESIPADKFKSNQELSGIFSVFTKNLVAAKKVAVLSTKTSNADLKSKNQARIDAMNALYNDENMYLAENARLLRDQGLQGFGETGNYVRFHPSCFETLPVGNHIVAESEEASKTQKQVTSSYNAARSITLDDTIFKALYGYLESKTNAKFQSAYTISSTISLGRYLLFISGGAEGSKFKIGFQGDRGPAILDNENKLVRYLNIVDSKEANDMWTQFMSAIARVENNHVGTRIFVQKNGQAKYKVDIVKRSENFGGGDEQYNTILVSLFKGSKMQFDKIVKPGEEEKQEELTID